jgi:hypothetical protein
VVDLLTQVSTSNQNFIDGFLLEIIVISLAIAQQLKMACLI